LLCIFWGEAGIVEEFLSHRRSKNIGQFSIFPFIRGWKKGSGLIKIEKHLVETHRIDINGG